MAQFLKSALFWQFFSGFALGTIGMFVFGPADATHVALRHIGSALGISG